MTKNMGTIDRSIRTIVALVLAALVVMHKISGTVAIIAAVVAAVFLLTSAIAFCPAYAPLKLSTLRKPKA